MNGMRESAAGRYVVGRRAIVLGGMGFIGANLVRRLLDLGARVVVVDGIVPETGANPFNLDALDGALTIVRGNSSESDAWRSYLEPGLLLFHLAARNTHAYCNADPFGDAKINLLPQYAVIDAIRRLDVPARLVYASTRTVYDASAEGPVNEDAALRPQDIYSLHTLHAERLFGFYSGAGIDCRILRLTNTYGPRQRLAGKEIGLVGEILRSALLDVPFDIYGDGTAARDINHVDDVVDAMIEAGGRDGLDGLIANLGGMYTSTREIVESVGMLTGWNKARYIDAPSRSIPPLDITTATERLGWRPRVNIEAGLTNTFMFFERYRDKYIDSRNS